jgi:glycosyltransferase involved in cell wall biosynthesis
VQKPSTWIIEREEAEYQLADQVQVFAQFSKNSFLARGFDPTRLAVVPLGVRVQAFRPTAAVVTERLARLKRGEPLRVVCVGNVSRQKGIRTWSEFFARTDRTCITVRFVGELTSDAQEHIAVLNSQVEFRGKVPQAELPIHYAWADLFVLPTIQDGFSVVVAQALAACVPVITTTSNGAADVIVPNETGWVIPPQRADVLNETLAMLNADRTLLCSAVERLQTASFDLDWAESARQALSQAERIRQKN